jgi:pyridoxal phosphate enzyme (YggS family)
MELARNYELLQHRIVAACDRAGRNPASITFLAASKGMPPEIVCQAAAAGLTCFGENKVQEARAKIPNCPGHLRWHLIGHLQSNKCRDAVALFDMIQSVDSVGVAEELQKWADKQAKTMPVLLEVNVAGEASKFGIQPKALPEMMALLQRLPRLEIQGLMTIAPWAPEPEKARPHFRALAELKKRSEDVSGVELPHLSMGMSGDFETAIEEGATIVRLGTALFGARPRVGMSTI